MATQTIKFDLMKPMGGNKRYIATLQYPRNPLFKFDFKDFYQWILNKRPTLKGQKIVCELYDKTKTILYFNMNEAEIMKYE